MSTRAQIRFATREAGVSFDKHPDAIHAQFYKHSDGYPEGLGLDIAESIMNNVGVTNWDYIWQYPGKETWISIFEVGWEQPCECCGAIKTEDQWEDSCIFVGLPTDLINKYKINTNDDG